MNTLHETKQDLKQMKQRWQTQPATGPDLTALRERVAADNRTQKRLFATIFLASFGILAASFIHAIDTDRTTDWFIFVFTASFMAVVWLAALWLSRGTWRPRDGSTAAYLELSIRRCQSAIMAAPAGVVLYVLGLAGALISRQRISGTEWNELLVSPSMIIAGWLGAPLYTLGMLWNAQRHRKRLQMLQELKRQLRE